MKKNIFKFCVIVFLFMFMLSGCTSEKHYNEWLKDGNDYYYYDSNGNKVCNQWQKYGNDWYYLDDSGKMKKSTWIENYYVDETGKMLKDCTKSIAGKEYVFDSNGKGKTLLEYQKEIENTKPAIGTITKSMTGLGKYNFVIPNKVNFQFNSGGAIFREDSIDIYQGKRGVIISLKVTRIDSGNNMVKPYLNCRLSNISSGKSILGSTTGSADAAIMSNESTNVIFSYSVDTFVWAGSGNKFEIVFYE